MTNRQAVQDQPLDIQVDVHASDDLLIVSSLIRQALRRRQRAPPAGASACPGCTGTRPRSPRVEWIYANKSALNQPRGVRIVVIA
jgi:hypothetical protein